MAVQMPLIGLLIAHRLVRICASSQTQHRHRNILLRLTQSKKEIKTFSTSCRKYNDNEKDSSDPPPLKTQMTSRQALLSRRRRPLSPLERISHMLPQDTLSPEVMQLREQNQQEPEEETHIQKFTQSAGEESKHEASDVNSSETQLNDDKEENVSIPPTLPGERLYGFGELLLAEYRKKLRVEFRKMFQLAKGMRLQSQWGIILHDDIAGQPSGGSLKTNNRVPIFIRRPSLDEYVLYMKRGPAISYPKDAATMIMMMDVAEGDCVLESGSGSGAMTLFLSRAVGSKGTVLSVEVRDDHHKRAMLNYNRWRASWRVRRGEEWPDNVQFHHADLRTATSLLTGRSFNSVALDLINPHLVLPTVIPHLHSGAVCTVYLANITQVVDLLEGIRCLALPLVCERIIEVPLREWLVAPALQKDGQHCVRRAPVLKEEHKEEEEEGTSGEEEAEMTTEGTPTFGSIPYIARPHPEQMSHTAFLVKLRKCVP